MHKLIITYGDLIVSVSIPINLIMVGDTNVNLNNFLIKLNIQIFLYIPALVS